MDSIRSRPKSLIVEDSSLTRIKCQHTPSLSADLAPVHSSGSKHLNKVQEMENKVSIIDSDPFNPNLNSNFQEKLSLNPKFKGKNCNKNGIRIGTTDVEVHCGPASPGSAKVFPSKSTVSDVTSSLGTLSPSQGQAQLNSQSSQENKTNALIGLCSNNSNKPQRPTSVNSPLINFKSELNITSNGTICNGHTVSEATSSNSIAISDFSLSSDKSTSLDSSFSCPGSGARPRTRNTSNSSSQSTQPQSECEVDLSSTSDSSKLLDGSLIPDPVQIFTTNVSREKDDELPIDYVNYENEHQMEAIMRLIQKDLSEPYSIYTYRYFIHNWPKLCFLAMNKGEVVGAIVCKLDLHKKATVRGYIAMLAVDHRYRKRRIGSNLVLRAIREMAADDADEVVLETEITNKPALQLYENLGFVRDKRLFRYYLNGVDALRLKLWLR